MDDLQRTVDLILLKLSSCNINQTSDDEMEHEDLLETPFTSHEEILDFNERLGKEPALVKALVTFSFISQLNLNT